MDEVGVAPGAAQLHSSHPSGSPVPRHPLAVQLEGAGLPAGKGFWVWSGSREVGTGSNWLEMGEDRGAGRGRRGASRTLGRPNSLITRPCRARAHTGAQTVFQRKS